MRVDSEKPLLVNIGVKVSPSTVIALQSEARNKGTSVSELVRGIVDSHLTRPMVSEELEKVLEKFFANRVDLMKV